MLVVFFVEFVPHGELSDNKHNTVAVLMHQVFALARLREAEVASVAEFYVGCRHAVDRTEIQRVAHLFGRNSVEGVN